MGGHGDLEGLGFCFSLVICNLYLPHLLPPCGRRLFRLFLRCGTISVL